MAISIALFGLSASGVYVFLMRDRWRAVPTERLLAGHAFAFTLGTAVALFVLVRLKVGLSYTPSNIALMSTVYVLSAVPFFAGGAAISLAITRLSAAINAVYAADLLGAGVGCLLLMPALQWAVAGPPKLRNRYTSGDTRPDTTLIRTESREFRRNFPWRDGRVVDGGGLESINALSSLFAFLRLNSARHGR